MMFVFLFISLTSSEKILEYQFYKNFGQMFYDYSLNNQFGMNGIVSTKDTSDCISTDRGIYLAKENEVQLPSNAFQPTIFTLPSTFSIYLWAMVTGENTFNIFVRKLSADKFFLIKIKNEKFIQFQIAYGSDSGNISYNFNKIRND